VPERVRRFDAAAAALALLVAVAAFGCVDLGGAVASFVSAVAALSVFVRLGAPSPRLGRVIDSSVVTLALASLPIAYVWTLYPVVSEPTLRRLVGLAAIAFAGLLAVLLLLRSEAWPARRPVTIGVAALLIAGALDPEAPARAQWAPAAGGGLWLAWLLLDRRPFDFGARGRRVVALLGFVALAAPLALGIARFLPWAQPKVEAVTSGILAPKSGGVSYAGLSFNSRLGDIEELALSRRVVMRVETDVPQRLRARVFTHFDGKTWRAEPAPGAAALVPVDDALLNADEALWFARVPGSLLSVPGREGLGSPGPGSIRTRVVQTAWNEGALATPARPRLVRLPASAGRIDDFGILTASPASAVEIYAIINRPSAAQAPPSRSLSDDLLELPRDIDPRILELAAALAANAASPEARVAAVTGHLARECRYALKVGAFSSRQPVAEFLFSKKRGYCEFFATAAALLLRAQGVRTRYVTGFNVRDDNLLGGRYVVRESDAHAWIEVYLPGQGFVEVDPTPSAQYAAVHDQRAGPWASLRERVAAFFGELLARLRGGDYRSTLFFALRAARLPMAGAMLLAAAWLGLRRWRRRPKAAPPAPADAELPEELKNLVADLEERWRRLGHPRAKSRTLQEHSDALPEDAAGPAARRAEALVIACYYRARYGGLRPERSEIRLAREAFQGLGETPGGAGTR